MLVSSYGPDPESAQAMTAPQSSCKRNEGPVFLDMRCIGMVGWSLLARERFGPMLASSEPCTGPQPGHPGSVPSKTLANSCEEKGRLSWQGRMTTLSRTRFSFKCLQNVVTRRQRNPLRRHNPSNLDAPTKKGSLQTDCAATKFHAFKFRSNLLPPLKKLQISHPN